MQSAFWNALSRAAAKHIALSATRRAAFFKINKKLKNAVRIKKNLQRNSGGFESRSGSTRSRKISRGGSWFPQVAS